MSEAPPVKISPARKAAGIVLLAVGLGLMTPFALVAWFIFRIAAKN
jgi:hypothetical protein